MTGTADTAPLHGQRRAGAASGWAILLAGGGIGLLASLVLVIERYELLLDPGYVPSCSLNPVLSCGSVMTAPQAALLGFPNPILGIPAFTVVVVTGVLTLAAVALPRWYWAGLAAGSTVGVVLVHWLIFQSLFRIGALCPYCIAVWAVTIPLWLTAVARATASSVVRAWMWPAAALWYTVIALACIERFWDYWRTLL